MKNVLIRSMLIFGLGITTSLTLAGFLGSFFWLFDLVAHFLEYYFLSFTFLLAAFVYFKLRWAAALSFLGLLMIGITLVGINPGLRSHTSSQNEITLFVANVKRENRSYQKTISEIQQNNPEVIVLLEPDQAWIDQMQVFKDRYPFTVFEARDDNFGVLLMSRFELSEARIERFGKAQVPTLVANLTWAGKKIQLIGTHPYPPFSAENTELRDNQLLSIAQFIHQAATPTVLVGDFNATPFSSIYRDLLTKTKLGDCSRGFGLQRTWQKNALIPPIPLAIDHCLVTPDVIIHSMKVGSDIGSDHRPLIIRFSNP